MVYEVDCVVLMSGQNQGGESTHTESVCADVVTNETVHLRKVTAMKGAKVGEALPALPHWMR